MGSSPRDGRATRFFACPYLEAEDIAEALSYAAWRAQEVEVPLSRDV